MVHSPVSPNHFCLLSNVMRTTVHSICPFECSQCISMSHSSRRMTSPSPMHMLSATTTSPIQALLRSPSPSMPRSAPISRKNSVLPDILDSSSTSLSQEDLLSVVQRCCNMEPMESPDFATLRDTVMKLNSCPTMGIVLESLLDRMEQYA